MSALLEPKGPETPATYWRRRLAVLAVGALVLALAWWLLSLLTGPGGKPATISAVPANDPTLAGVASPSSTAKPSASASATLTAQASASASATPTAQASASAPASKVAATPSTTPSATPTGPVACDPSAVDLSLDGSRSPVIGKPTSWKVNFQSGDGKECRLDLAKHPLQLQVTSGSDEIWSTEDCSNWAPDKPVDLVKGRGQVVISWPLQRSGKGCKLAKEELRAGTYVATARLGGASARLVMLLHF